MNKIGLILGSIVFVVLLIFIFQDEDSAGMNVALNGISTHYLANRIMDKYDVNGNKKLEVSEESFLRTDLDGVKQTESHGLLFTHADEMGNNDGATTQHELENFLSQFDRNGDGEITSYENIIKSIFTKESEWVPFQREYGERHKYD